MVNADCSITIFNTRVDKETRREVFVPTWISGVSLYDVRGLSDNSRLGDTTKTEKLSFRIRIPASADIQSGRTYLPENRYKALSDEELLKYWSIQKGCYILGIKIESGRDVLTKDELDALKASSDPDDFIVVQEYADNTRRGTDAAKHWRIGGI